VTGLSGRGIASIARSTELPVDFEDYSRRARGTFDGAPISEVEVPVLFLCALYYALSSETVYC
jgi:hypothetical protein